MVVRISEEQGELSLSVGDLLSSNPFHHEPTGFKFGKRLSIGQKLHQEYGERKSNDNSQVTTEKFIKLAFDHKKDGKKWSVKLAGRIDVYRVKGRKTEVDEVKTLTPAEFDEVARWKEASSMYQRFADQVQLYLYMLEKGEGIKARGFIVLINIENGKTRKIEVKKTDMAEFIHEHVDVLLDEWQKRARDLKKRAKNAKKVSFPFPDFRPHQETITDTVKTCLQARNSLMVSAPTGTGKTVSVLFPALKYAFQEGKRIFYVTPKTTQQKLVIETMDLFKKQRVTFTMVVLQAKEKSCLNSSYYCHPDFCQYIRDYYERLKPEYLEKLRKKKVVTPRIVKNLAKKVRLCPFELSLDLSLEADLILGDYNYVFDPSVYLKRFFLDRKYDDFLLVVDEAHNLYSRGQGYYSPAIGIRELERIKDEIDLKKRKIYSPFKLLAKQLLEHLEKVLETAGNEHRALVDIDADFFQSMKTALDERIEYYFIWKNKNAASPTRDDPVEKFYHVFNRFYTVLKISQGLEEFRYYAVTGQYGSLNILCLDPSRFLNKRIKGFWNCTTISATLLPADFYKKVLGMPVDTEVLITPSPFPTKNRKIVVIPEVSTLYRERSQSARKVAWIINSLARISPGNYFAFFPSFEYMKIVEQELKPEGMEILVQDRIMSERSRREFLEKMESNKKRLLCLGVMGGIFSEGVDYPGELLKGVFLVGPGLPAYNFENELVRQHFDRKYKGEGWKFAYLYPGMNRVIQAAGRPIRTMDDTGIIVLLGRRFATREYSELFPRDWYRTLPEELVAEDYLGETSSFWKSHGKKTNSYSYEE